MHPFPTILLAALLWPATVAADTFLWRVSDGERTLLLGGTLHVLGADDYPLPEPFDDAYAAADTLVLETDPRGLATPEAQMRLLRSLTYRDGTTVFDVLDDETDERLTELLAARGLPVEAFATFRPGMLLSALTMLELQRLGVSAEGVDAHYLARATDDGKPLIELETPQFQIDMLAALGGDDPDALIDWLLDDLDELDEAMDMLIAAWRTGDRATIRERFVDPLAERLPDDHEALLTARNRAWLDALEGMLDSPATELVLVGAAHLVGEDGLLALLDARGYAIEPM